ncbi:MAG: SpaA isopeptide-forming pilin-related protein [Berryella intestinalis]|uniref:SpaA isopeptide-forming pilin-related protein n=1 Tax=Berryella intestinalis TaxID=1531429 RepID=UPI002A595BE6|nr:SpaA isopeptide-forming pilin-related protein [Berryella intestinalis]MDD7368960.1 SpaA isopeptide-forming pilin-related protein [Berryella intestinalis]MDY3128895.1 SpaA isopeptide-forming pilin-related protein [Berryella intestinalis]
MAGRASGLQRLFVSFALLVGFSFLFNTGSSAEAESVLCGVGKNVDNNIANVEVSHEKRDYNGQSSDWQVNNYQYLLVTMKGEVDNRDSSIREGDFFTIKLDDRLRPNGIFDEESVSALIPTLTTTVDGSDVVVAVPDYNPTTKTIRYVFTEYIESVNSLDFMVKLADYPDLKHATSNGTYTFNSTYAGTPYSYTYDVLWEKPLPEPSEVAAKEVRQTAMVTNVLISEDSAQNKYTHRAYARFYNVADADRIAISYTGTSPYTAQTRLKVYGLADGAAADSFGADVSSLEDVTAKFSITVQASGIKLESTVAEAGYTHFVVELVNDFDPNAAINSYLGFSINGGQAAGTTVNIAKESLMAAAYAIGNKDEVPCREVRNLEITKVDADDSSKKLAGATFEAYRAENGVAKGDPIQTVTTDQSGTAVVESLDLRGQYVLVEKTAPEGYLLDKTPVKVSIKDLDKGVPAVQLSVQNKRIDRIDFTASKVWVGGSNERPAIQLQLFCDGQKLGDPVTLKDGAASYTWKDLDKTDQLGTAYRYTVDEVEVPAGYRKSVEGAVITNTFVEEEAPGKIEEPSGDNAETPSVVRTVPPASAAKQLPVTGDSALYLLCAAVIAASLIGIAVAQARRNRD